MDQREQHEGLDVESQIDPSCNSQQISSIRNIYQAIFLILLSIVSCVGIIKDEKHTQLWILLLILCVAQALGLPLFAVLKFVLQRPKL